MKFKNYLIRLNWILISQLGINIIVFLKFFINLPRFISNLILFKKKYKGKIEIIPCLHDWSEEGGTTKDEYFLQDLIVARLISIKKPFKHVDVGSRIDGFVSHVASFREIEVIDIRPISSIIPGINFLQADLMNLNNDINNKIKCDSLSCLHTLEHFGLGRYGDPINIDGYKIGFNNLVSLLIDDGVFYISVPVGEERVEFNANRVFDPFTILELAKSNYLQLQEFINIKGNGEVYNYLTLDNNIIQNISNQRYSLGIFIFKKMKNG
jgi:hypothetical protein